VPQKGEMASVVLKLAYNLRHQNQSTFTYLIEFIVYYERTIRVSIACPLYVCQSVWHGNAVSSRIFGKGILFSIGQTRFRDFE
jgi:hypothetical protein